MCRAVIRAASKRYYELIDRFSFHIEHRSDTRGAGIGINVDAAAAHASKNETWIIYAPLFVSYKKNDSIYSGGTHSEDIDRVRTSTMCFENSGRFFLSITLQQGARRQIQHVEYVL